MLEEENLNSRLRENLSVLVDHPALHAPVHRLQQGQQGIKVVLPLRLATSFQGPLDWVNILTLVGQKVIEIFELQDENIKM